METYKHTQRAHQQTQFRLNTTQPQATQLPTTLHSVQEVKDHTCQPTPVCRPASPPHSSMDTPGTSTTRTTSSYFSPNMAVAPAARAASSSISAVAVGEAAATQLLTSRSTSETSAGVTGRLRLKSNLSNTCRGRGQAKGVFAMQQPCCRQEHHTTQHAGLIEADGSRQCRACVLLARPHLSLLASTRLPCWQVSGPSTCLSALCSRCVAV